MDFDFGGHAGWAAARKAFPRRMPPNWAFTLRLRARRPRETLEFKLLDPTGENVWWSVRRGFDVPGRMEDAAHQEAPGGVRVGARRAAARSQELGFVEITVTARPGGRGRVEIDELALEELPLEEGPLPSPRAWKGDPAGGEKQQLVLDLGGRRELGGLALDWDAADFARVYDVEMSDDGKAWSTARSVAATRGGRAWIALPDVRGRLRAPEAREERAGPRLRPRASRGRAARVRRDADEVPRVGRGRVAARTAGRARCVEEQLYWTLVGVDGGREKGLLSEDGALETGRGAFARRAVPRLRREVLADGPNPTRRSRSTTATCRSRRFCATTRTACRSRCRLSPTDLRTPR